MPRPSDLVERQRLGLHSLVVDQLNAQRRCIARYGAVAEATTLLSCCGSGKDFLHDVVDRKPFSHGRYMPGSELRIRPLDKPLADQPDHALLRTWNFAEEILEQQAEDRAGGGRSRASHDGKLGSDAPPGTAIHQECRQMTSSSSPYVCPSCGGRAACPFYEVDSVPVHQVKLVRTRAAALNCPRGDIRMCFCPRCGFVWNGAFDPACMRYDEDYESTQAVSPTFNAFHERLARDLIARFDLHGKRVVELGCGQGEFITMLAEMGGNRGYGFDQVIRQPGASGKVTLIKDLYTEPYRDLAPDFVCCKMTLEHVQDVSDFLRGFRRTVGDRPETEVFFMIPEITRILNLRAFWDIYYEHCSYWSPGSLARAFRMAGFDPIEVWTDYDDQYVLIAARPGSSSGKGLPGEEPPQALAAKVRSFSEAVAVDRARWRGWLDRLRHSGQKAVLWGGGSKAVAFLSTLDVREGIEYTVDVNPRRDGTFIAGTGQQIVVPEFLVQYRPDLVIVMSPIYLLEITAQLESMNVRPKRLLAVEAPDQLEAA